MAVRIGTIDALPSLLEGAGHDQHSDNQGKGGETECKQFDHAQFACIGHALSTPDCVRRLEMGRTNTARPIE